MIYHVQLSVVILHVEQGIVYSIMCALGNGGHYI